MIFKLYCHESSFPPFLLPSILLRFVGGKGRSADLKRELKPVGYLIQAKPCLENFISSNITGALCRVVMMVGWHEVPGGATSLYLVMLGV